MNALLHTYDNTCKLYCSLFQKPTSMVCLEKKLPIETVVPLFSCCDCLDQLLVTFYKRLYIEILWLGYLTKLKDLYYVLCGTFSIILFKCHLKRMGMRICGDYSLL